MRGRTGKRFLTILLALILCSQPAWGLAEVWGMAWEKTEIQDGGRQELSILSEAKASMGENFGAMISGNAVSENMISENAGFLNVVSEDEISGNGISANTVSEDAISGNTISVNMVSGNTASENDISENGISINQVSANQTSANEIPENGLSENALSENTLSENALSGNAAEEKVSASENQAGETLTCKVTFQSKGGSAVKSQTVAKGGQAKKPANPTKSKYLFAGWYNGKQAYDFTKAVTKDLTLTAKWTKVTVGRGSVKKLSNTSKGVFKVKLAKVKGAKGYQVQVSTDKTFRSKTQSYLASGTALTIRDRYQNKTYYVRAQAYQLDSKKEKIYGKFSSKKSLKAAKGIQKVAPSRTAASITSVSLISGETVRVKAKVRDYVKSADNYYYLFHLNGNGNNVAKNTQPDAKVKKNTSVTMKTPLNYGKSASKLQSKFLLAVKTSSGTYSVISGFQYISNPEALASYHYAFPKTATKKGLQVDPAYIKDAVNLGVKHVAYNICLDDLIAAPDQKNQVQGISYRYNGSTYWFNRSIIEGIDHTLDQYRDKNMVVTAILLLRWRDDLAYLIPAAARAPGHGYYALNTSQAKARKHWEAVFTFLAQRYTPDKRIVNWILGNEVNNYGSYHYTGSVSLENNAKLYANAYRLAYIAIRSVYDKARVYISLDQVWNYLVANSHTSKQFLDKFADYWDSYGDFGNFHIAFHPYPAPLEDPAFWTNSRGLVSNTIGTPCITMSNLKILTNYVKNKWGSGTRIILSEQGFTSNRYGVDVPKVQAAALAYAYYLAEFNNMVDAFILHRQVDHRAEMSIGLYLGLWTNDASSSQPAAMGQKKDAWEVFKYMDTSKGAAKTKFALTHIGASSWKAAVPGYDTARFQAY